MFEQAINEIRCLDLAVHGIEVRQGGDVIYRFMSGEDIRYPAYSAAKSVTALGVGLAVSEGCFDINSPLAYWLTESELSAMLPHRREQFCRLPVTRFLTMSVKGYPFRPEGGDPLRNCLSRDIDYSAVPRFDYSNVQAYLVGLACERAVGIPMEKYLNSRLFEPMDIPRVGFQTDLQGRFYGATGMSLKISELAGLGQLLLDGGRGIVSGEWIREMTSTHISTKESGYGYFIWTQPGRFYISGKWGQRSIVCPELDAVITYMSDLRDNSELMTPIADSIIKELADEAR